MADNHKFPISLKIVWILAFGSLVASFPFNSYLVFSLDYCMRRSKCADICRCPALAV